MEPKERMRNSIHLVMDNVQRIHRLSRSVRDELKTLPFDQTAENTISTVREQLCEIQTRLEGIEEFLQACEQWGEKQSDEKEEIEFWL